MNLMVVVPAQSAGFSLRNPPRAFGPFDVAIEKYHVGTPGVPWRDDGINPAERLLVPGCDHETKHVGRKLQIAERDHVRGNGDAAECDEIESHAEAQPEGIGRAVLLAAAARVVSVGL